MPTLNGEDWQHSHVFDQDRRNSGETRTLVVVLVTVVMMVVEITAGLVYGSMALLADGLHMASHALALGIALFAYVISRRLATDRSFSFGVGKINSVAGYTSAVLLLGFALLMATESVERLVNPVPIVFNSALVVAVLGLLVNGFCAWVLMSTPHDHGHGHGHEHDDDDGHAHGGDHDHHHGHGHDHNLRAAYLHVLADALTSLLAIVALLAGKYAGANWMDPAMGIVGAVLVARWSWGLIRSSLHVLLDRQVDAARTGELARAVSAGSTDEIADLHCWCIGHNLYAAEFAVVTDAPRAPAYYKARIPRHLKVVHVTVEVHRRGG